MTGTPNYRDIDSDGDGIPDSADSQRLESNDRFTVIDASTDRTEVTVGEEVEVALTVRNTAEERSEFAVQLRDDGALERTETFAVPGNETTTVRTSYRVTEPGEHTVEVNRIEAGTVRAGAADGEPVDALSGGDAFPMLVVLVLIGVVLALIGYVRYRGRSDS